MGVCKIVKSLETINSVLHHTNTFAHLVEMSKKRKHSSCSLKDKLELLKRIDKGESATKLALEFFLHPVLINRKFGLARLYYINKTLR
jgi:hypothetical protein